MPLVEDPLVVMRRLAEELLARQAEILTSRRYFNGDVELPFTTNTAVSRRYRGLMRESRANWCSTVAEATYERIIVDGFRVGDDTDADEAARTLWNASRFDAASELLFAEAVVSGSAGVLVDLDGRMYAESPLEVIVEYEPGSTQQRYAALKLWHDPRAKIVYANLYDDTWVYSWQAKADSWDTSVPSSARWDIRAETLAHGLGAVPIVEVRNRPTIGGRGRSELSNVIPLQDALNDMLFDMLMAGHFAAFAQKWVTGIEIPTDPATGLPIEPFDAAVNRLFVAESPDTKFGAFPSTELDGYVRAIEMLVQSIASITRTPPHYLLNISGVLPNSESLRAAEAGLIAKVRRRSVHFGDALEDAMSMALRAVGDARADDPIETIFRDPEFHSPGMLADSTTKLVQAGIIPVQQAWADLGYSAAAQERMQQWRADEAFMTAVPGL